MNPKMKNRLAVSKKLEFLHEIQERNLFSCQRMIYKTRISSDIKSRVTISVQEWFEWILLHDIRRKSEKSIPLINLYLSVHNKSDQTLQNS